MKNVLFVENASVLGNVVRKRLANEPENQVTWVRTHKEAQEALETQENPFFAAILDYSLPDAPEGETIDLMNESNVPVIVYTGEMASDIRDTVWNKKVVDYVLQEGEQSLTNLQTALRRLETNPNMAVLVVDDSLLFREHFATLLRVQRFDVVIAESGEEALDILTERSDIKLVLTDCHMPGIDGIELTRRIRRKYSPDDMAVIGISAEGDSLMAALFLKNGADDFLIKQHFLVEEFYGRINRNIDNLARIEQVREATVRDYLTGLYNRHYFLATAHQLYANAQRQNLSLTCAVLNIDNLKEINEAHGHETGDLVLKHVADVLGERMRDSDLLARLGGEEFGILAVNLAESHIGQVFEILRDQLITNPIVADDEDTPVEIIVSIGVANELPDNFIDQLKLANERQCSASLAGQNCIELPPELVEAGPK